MGPERRGGCATASWFETALTRLLTMRKDLLRFIELDHRVTALTRQPCDEAENEGDAAPVAVPHKGSREASYAIARAGWLY